MPREIIVNKEYHKCDCKGECSIDAHTEHRCFTCDMCKYLREEAK